MLTICMAMTIEKVKGMFFPAIGKFAKKKAQIQAKYFQHNCVNHENLNIFWQEGIVLRNWNVELFLSEISAMIEHIKDKKLYCWLQLNRSFFPHIWW